jgi:hypothetical protein
MGRAKRPLLIGGLVTAHCKAVIGARVSVEFGLAHDFLFAHDIFHLAGINKRKYPQKHASTPNYHSVEAFAKRK